MTKYGHLPNLGSIWASRFPLVADIAIFKLSFLFFSVLPTVS